MRKMGGRGGGEKGDLRLEIGDLGKRGEREPRMDGMDADEEMGRDIGDLVFEFGG
jgi:hypothetical protein